jgi:hypothetical protein
MNRIALAVALVAVPAPFKVAVTMQATVTTDLSASQTHIAAGSGACGFVDVNGTSHRTLQFATPTPIVLSMSELTHPRPGRLLPGFTASSISNAAFTETFSSPCSSNTCTSLSFGWFVDMFPSQAQVPCDKPLSSNEADCGTTPVPVEIRNVYADNRDDLFTKFDAGELDVGVSLEAPRAAARCSAWWPFFKGFGTDVKLTPAQLEKRLAKGHALVVKGSDVHYFPAFEGIVTQQSAWTFRIVRAR